MRQRFSRFKQGRMYRLGAAGFDWALRAGRYERRVYAGALVGGMAWVGLGGAFLFATAFMGPLGFIFLGGTMLFVTLFGVGIPAFIVIAWGGLWRRRQYWTPAGILEDWVNPDMEGHPPFTEPGYVRRINGAKAIITLSGWGDEWEGKPLPYRRSLRLYTTADVNKAIDHDQDIEHFRAKSKLPNVPIRLGAIAVIIAASLFIGLAVISDTNNRNLSAAGERTQFEEVAP